MNSVLSRALAVSLALAAAQLSPAAPPPAVNKSDFAVLIRKLDADGFWTRQRAEQSLNRMGKKILPQLRAELTRTESAEVRARLNRLIHVAAFQERLPDLVKQLGSTQHATWFDADQQLRQAGRAAVPLLKKEMKPGLDLNRRKRLEKIIAELSR